MSAGLHPIPTSSNRMATQKSKWTGTLHSPINVLNHADCLHLEKFTNADLDEIADCTDVYELNLYGSKTGEPIDLARLAHITELRSLELERVPFKNLAALKALPHLRHLVIKNGDFTDFEELNGFKALRSLFLWYNKLTRFPAGLDLPQLGSLYVSDNRITDLGFVKSYPSLTNLYARDNRITDLAPLAACTWLEELNLDSNPIDTLAPLAGLKFRKLSVDEHLRGEKVARQLEWPEEPYVPPANLVESRRIAQLIKAKDWPQVDALHNTAELRSALHNVFHGDVDEETLRGLLAHPGEGVFDEVVIYGLNPHYSRVRELAVAIFCEWNERLMAPLGAGLERFLNTERHHDAFDVGKLKTPHFAIADILVKLASPAFADLFLAFLDLRENFSFLHLQLYKRLLDAVGKTQSPLLVEPLIDLLRFEKHIIGGDAAFMKKIFKAIGQLGSKADATVLASRFDVAAENRADVVAAYDATMARLDKKKA